MNAASCDPTLIAALYETALHDGDWAPALERCADLLGSIEVCLSCIAGGEVAFETTGRMLDEGARERYEGYYHGLDPKRALFRAAGVGFLFNDSAHFDDQFVATSAFYQEFSLPTGGRHTLDLLVDADATRQAYFAAMRTGAQGRYQPDEEKSFAEMAAHFARVRRLKDHLDLARGRASYAVAALDQLRFGLVVLGGDGRAVVENAAARRIFAEGAIALRAGRLTLRDPAAARELDAMIARALAGAYEAAALRVAGAAERAWVLWVMRLPPSSPMASGEAPGAMVLIGDPDAGGRIRRSALMSLYALTPAEADLALALAGGATLKTIAQDRGVKINTARSQLLAVLEKTGVHRQADLTRILATLPGAYLGDADA